MSILVCVSCILFVPGFSLISTIVWSELSWLPHGVLCGCLLLHDTSNFRPCSFFENLFCETYVFWVPSFSRSAVIPGIQHLQTQTTRNLLYIQPSRHGPIAIPLQQLLFLVTPRQTLNLNINQLLWQDNYMHYGTVQQTATVVLAAGNSFVEKYTSTPSSTQPHTHTTASS